MMTIELSNDEAEAFKAFRQYQEIVAVMANAGVHNLRNGSATLHFGPDGKLQEVVTTFTAFRR